MKFAISQPKVVRLPRDEKQTYRFELWASNLTMGLTLAMTLIFEFSRSYMILTIWWPRSSLRIYQIVTGVTSVVGVPSTHLVGSDNGLSPGRCQAIIWTNAGILLIGPLGTNFSEILIEIHIFSFQQMHLKMLSGKWLPFCLGLNVLTLRYLEGCQSMAPYSNKKLLEFQYFCHYLNQAIIWNNDD